MIGVTLQSNENIDRALKRFKKKYERSGVLREFKKTYILYETLHRKENVQVESYQKTA